MNAARRKQIDAAIALIGKIGALFVDLENITATLASEENDAFEALPESIQQSERGQEMERASELLQEVSDDAEAIDLDDYTARLMEARGE